MEKTVNKIERLKPVRVNFDRMPMIRSGSRGAVFIDLNETAISDATKKLTMPAEKLQSTIAATQAAGWTVGLCSDSPGALLDQWGKKYGMNGSTIGENGLMVDSVPLIEWSAQQQHIERAITQWARSQQIPMLPERQRAKEFGGTRPQSAGIAFGESRHCSMSIFTFTADGRPAPEIITLLAQELEQRYGNALAIDPAAAIGWLGIHALPDFRAMKRTTLKMIGERLRQNGKRLYMIGNSVSDVVGAPELCTDMMVANASAEAKAQSCITLQEPLTAGVIEGLKKITTEQI
ncbi:MAG: hypothetical protein KIH62_004475 [Candidatus Kerfeldbacteria bacterium]|nr:hypothetical protein [Candidatus Kerfeldbacteria bacterium]